ncbi:MAG: nitroreductase/quinone reductase family protein [Chloroflexota bacterium]
MPYCQSLQQLEKAFYANLNQILEPLIRAGVGSPGLVPVGPIVVEAIGRKSGRVYNTPVLATECADLLLISTVRSRSQWYKNLASTPQTRVWLRGQPQDVAAHIISPHLSLSSISTAQPPSPLARLLIDGLRPFSTLTGVRFAIFEPRQ